MVTPDGGLMNPNHYLAVAIDYLLRHRDGWPADAAIGKTLVSSIDDRPGRGGARPGCVEVPVGFKWFVPGLLDGSIGFGGEESAGASFLRRDGTVWTTDKDGILLDLLAAEIIAVTGRIPREHYRELTARSATRPTRASTRPATREEKAVLAQAVARSGRRERAGRRADPAMLTTAPGNGAPIGGLKVAPSRAGSPPARPARRTSTRSTRSLQGPRPPGTIQEEARAVVWRP